MKKLALRWAALPRAGRWLAVFLGFLGLSYLAIEPAVDAYTRFTGQAEADRAALVRFEQAEDQVRRDAEATTLGLKNFGVVDPPGESEARSEALNRAIDQILRRNGVEGHTSTTRTVPMPKGRLSEKIPTGFRLERLSKTIDFTAHPGAVAGVIADLEQAPVVATISSVSLKQAESRDRSGRLLNATISIEAWVLARKEGSR
jgi:hypothetical protein